MNAQFLLNRAKAEFGIDVTEKKRTRNHVYCRYAIIKILRNTTLLSLEKIGNIFNLDHSTVTYALSKHDQLIKYDDYKKVYSFFIDFTPSKNSKHCAYCRFKIRRVSL